MWQPPTLFELVVRHIEPWLLHAWLTGSDLLPLFKKKTPGKLRQYQREWRLMKLRSYLKRHPGKALKLTAIWQTAYKEKQAWTEECIRRFGH